MTDIDLRVKELEEKLNKIANIITGKETSKYNLDTLGDKMIEQVNGTVRMKDAILVFPTLTKADQDARTAKGNDLTNLQTMIAIPDNPEIMDAFRLAFKDALNYALKTGKLPKDFNANDPSQNPFVDVNEWLNNNFNDASYLREALEGKRLIKNCKFNDEGERPSVLLDQFGEPYSDSRQTTNLARAEIVITFAAYNKAGKKGIGRYIQGIRIMEEFTGGGSSLFF